jgi:dihydrofolate reductase
MRKVIVANIVSLDGRFEGPGKDVMALPFDEAFNDYNAERLRCADTLLLGRTSFEGFQSYWPAVADDLDQPAVEREISRLNNVIEKVVVSDSLVLEEDAPWRSTTRVVPRADAHAAVAELKERDGREILIFGSRLMWNDLLRAGLVDEVHLMIGSAFLGGGTPVFEDGPKIPLRLLDVDRRDGAELVLLRYGT